jgi:hypothetical protein
MGALSALVTAVPDREIVYHYTSQDGLLGIIRHGSLWVSSIRHLNDSTEFAYSIDIVRENLNRRLRAERGPWNSYYGTILEEFDAIKQMTLLVGSFSEEGDLLSQWRAYTPNGVGFSTGFKYRSLQSLALEQKFRFIKCSYKESEHHEILNDLINEAGKRVTDGKFGDAVQTFFTGLFKFAPALKHPSFSEEKEWRVVSQIVDSNDNIKFRAGKSMVIPYGDFDLAEDGKMPLSKIIVGPTPHKELSVQSVRQLLFSNNINDCVVVPSSVPYRSW